MPTYFNAGDKWNCYTQRYSKNWHLDLMDSMTNYGACPPIPLGLAASSVGLPGKMDTDGSGEISLSALKQVLASNASEGSLGALTEKEVEDIFNAMRVNKSETRIHWHEFIAAGLSQCQVDDRNLRLAFDRLDSDHKGVSCLLLCCVFFFKNVNVNLFVFGISVNST